MDTKTAPLLKFGLACLLALTANLASAPAHAVRIKEIASVQGVRTNQLVGYGLVVGLDGTGDQTTSAPFTAQSLSTLLQQMGVTVPAGTNMQVKNVAAVMVTAQLPAFAQPGQTIDVTVSSMGNSKSLRGGTLIATPLKGADGQIYGLAQGNVVIGGAGAAAAGSKVQINQLSSGRIPAGATVERSVPTPLHQGNTLQLDLNTDDFSTARAVVRAINTRMGEGSATALNARAVQVRLPEHPDARINFLADIENLTLQLAAPSAKVILNARTGSVVINQAVTLGACAVAHGNLSVTISNTPVISQPGAFSPGSTVSRDRADITVRQEPGALIQVPTSTKLADVVKALSALGATPQDLLSILQAMQRAGALNAEIEVI